MASASQTAIAEICKHALFAKHAKQILAQVRPMIRFAPRKGKAADGKLGASRLGGDPDLPEGTAWPRGPGFDGDDVPMDFIAQVNLDAIADRDVDELLPKTGVLAFFLAQNYEGCAVIHGEHDDLVTTPPPGRKKSAKPPKHGGFDVFAEMALPPPWSAFVSNTKRSATAWNSRTGKRGKGDTLVELPPAAHDAYTQIYQNTLEHEQHGMFGYERPMEGVQRPGEVVLLRLDQDRHIPYDFVEVVSIYWFITEKALAKRSFDEVEVFCGSTI